MNYKEGDRIECIKRPESGKNGNFGKRGVVEDVDEDGVVYVTYDDGNEGNSDKPELYYKKINFEGYRAGTTHKVSGPVHREGKNLMDRAVNIVKRMTLTAGERKLIKAGLKTECGMYTDLGIQILLQDLANTDASQTRLTTVADAILAERKEAKDEEGD